MKTAIKIILLGLILIVAVAAICITWLTSPLHPHWPPITNTNGLLEECAHISDTAAKGLYPRDKWGQEIRKLNPLQVVAGDSTVNILFSTGGITDSGWGYYIYLDLRTNETVRNSRWHSQLIQPGIFKYEYR